jgi:hypothetical protein
MPFDTASRFRPAMTRDVHRRDVFISYASEDKEAIARPLAEHLRAHGYSVWFDDYELEIGDSLRAKIDDGVRHSRVGVVILSRAFFQKQWPRRELDGLTARQIAGEENVILPVLHNIGFDDVRSYSLPLADLVAARSSDGVKAIGDRVVHVLDVRRIQTDDILARPSKHKRALSAYGAGAAVASIILATILVALVLMPPAVPSVDLLQRARAATWRSAAGKVHFYTTGGVDKHGYASLHPAGSDVLEDGTSPRALGMHPEWKPHGWITGDFALPHAITDDQHFRARIGFVRANACNCGEVKFLVQVIFSSGTVSPPLVSRHDVQADGLMLDLDVPLSAVRGATTLRLRVEAGDSAVQDWAVWINPRIES